LEYANNTKIIQNWPPRIYEVRGGPFLVLNIFLYSFIYAGFFLKTFKIRY
jgi:hypothetical protein